MKPVLLDSGVIVALLDKESAIMSSVFASWKSCNSRLPPAKRFSPRVVSCSK